MNEEEKQIIERIKRDYELAKSEDAIDIDIFTEDIKTVLNLLEKKDTLIHTMQSEFERLEDLEDNTDVLKMELEKKDKDIIEAKEANRQLSVELQKKDKLIKVMAKNYVCKRKCNLEDKKNKYANCIECVIDFFERKVENGNLRK